MAAIETIGLSKHFGKVISLDRCDLNVPQGVVFGLLGPNGAGKSTLIRTLLGFLKPTAGNGRISQLDIRTQSLAVRAQTSYLPGDARLFRSMSGRQLLRMMSELHPRGSNPQALEVATRLELDLSRRVMFMSTGMRQKLALALALGNQAPVVILDEPTANLDPNVRGQVLELVREVRSSGRTVLLSSHIFSDIDETCDQVAILRNGRIAAVHAMPEVENAHWIRGNWMPPTRDRNCGESETSSDLGLPSKANLDQLLRTIRAEPSVRFCRSIPTERTEFNAAQDPQARRQASGIEFCIQGDPSSWLHWLSTLPLTKIKMEHAGIRGVYQMVHDPCFQESSIAREDCNESNHGNSKRGEPSQ